AESGMKFFSDGRAANNRAAFEDEGPEALLREIERGDEGIVPGAENHDIALDGHYLCPASFKISSAARRPGAPMIPPPGCVAEPHMYNFLMGVRYRAQPAAGRKKKSCSSESS